MNKINFKTKLGNHKYFSHFLLQIDIWTYNSLFFYTFLAFLFTFPIFLLLFILHLCFLLIHVCDVQLQKTWLLLPFLLLPMSSLQSRHRVEDTFRWLLVKLSSDKIHLWELLVFFWRCCGDLNLGFCRAAFIQYRRRRRGRGRSRPRWWRCKPAECNSSSSAPRPQDIFQNIFN